MLNNDMKRPYYNLYHRSLIRLDTLQGSSIEVNIALLKLCRSVKRIINIEKMSKLINQAELSRFLSGSDNSVRLNKCPKKYQRKVNRLVRLVSLWERWAK